MIAVQQIIDELNTLLEIELYRDLCPNGHQIEGHSQVEKIAFAVSADLKTIEAVCQWGAQALITHHGLLWNYAGARPLVGAHGKRVRLLIENKINLISYHLPLDGHPQLGNAAQIAQRLHLQNIERFGLEKGNYLGVSGELSKAISAEELKEQLAQLLNHSVIMATPQDKRPICSLGIITGGANNQWIYAQEAGLDAYLTGEISEYNWHDAQEGGVTYFAAGHHATERFGVMALSQILAEKYSIETRFFDSENPA